MKTMDQILILAACVLFLSFVVISGYEEQTIEKTFPSIAYVLQEPEAENTSQDETIVDVYVAPPTPMENLTSFLAIDQTNGDDAIVERTTWFNDTNPVTVNTFLSELEPYPWGGACSMHARFIYTEAEKVNLSIGEVTLTGTDRETIRRTRISGHRMNYFEYDGEKYFISNSRNVYKRCELPRFALECCGVDVPRIGTTNYKEPNRG